MSETQTLLDRPNQQLDFELGQGEWLHQRTEQALNDCDFLRTPELEQSVEGFYESHYRLASVMRLGLQGQNEQSMSDEDQRVYLNDIIDSSYFDRTEIERAYESRVGGYGTFQPYVQQVTPLLARVRLARLDNPGDPDLRKVELSTLAEAGNALFAEASVGVTTLKSPEADLLLSLHKAVSRQMKESGQFTHLPYDSEGVVLGDPFYAVNNAIDTFRRDSRFAGQLLFHNTGHFQDLSSRGEILPRRMQKERYGTINTQTTEQLDGHLHAPTPHWSESFDPNSYRGGEGGKNGGTVAVPLSKIVQAAPYARDAHYGVLTLKPEAATYVTDSIHRNDGIGNIGFGSPDYQGGGGKDRTFYRSPYDVPASAPVEEAPDGYAIPVDEETYWVQLEDEDRDKTWDSDVKPEPYTIPVHAYQEKDPEGRTVSVAVWRERRQRTVARSIRDLQERSISRYSDQVVAPLRAGVMDFHVPDDGAGQDKKRAQFTRIPKA